MLFFCLLLFMDFLEILYEIVDLGDIEELTDYIGRLDKANSQDILFDSALENALRIEKISMEPRYFSKKGLLTILVFGKTPSLVVKRALEECFNFEGIILFSKRQDLPLTFLIAYHN